MHIRVVNVSNMNQEIDGYRFLGSIILDDKSSMRGIQQIAFVKRIVNSYSLANNVALMLGKYGAEVWIDADNPKEDDFNITSDLNALFESSKLRILWFSRHQMTACQKNDLEKIFGDIEIKQVSATVSTWKSVEEAGSDCDVLAVVLPINIAADLVSEQNKMVIRSVSERIKIGTGINPANGQEEDKFMFSHGYWESLDSVVVQTTKLSGE